MKQTGFPALIPAYVLKVRPSFALMLRKKATDGGQRAKLVVGEGTPVGETHSGSTFVHYSTPGGSIKTVPGFTDGPKLDAEIGFAGDWIYFDPDKKYTRMNVKGVAKTPDGLGINFSYTGVSKVSDEVAAIFNHNPQTIAFGSSTTSNIFEVGDTSLKELENATWVGNGRFLMEEGIFKVETRISKVVASTDMD